MERLVREVPRSPRAVVADAVDVAERGADRVRGLPEPDAAERASRHERPGAGRPAAAGAASASRGQRVTKSVLLICSEYVVLGFRRGARAPRRRLHARAPRVGDAVRLDARHDGRRDRRRRRGRRGGGRHVRGRVARRRAGRAHARGDVEARGFLALLDGFEELAEGYRRWAFESAALDLALRQNGLGLGDALGRAERPVRFVVSTRAEPSAGSRSRRSSSSSSTPRRTGIAICCGGCASSTASASST